MDIGLLEEAGKDIHRKRNEIWVTVEKRKLRKVWNLLRKEGVFRISSISGLDTGRDLEVIYHFVSGEMVINIKTHLPRKNPEISTITDLFPGANLFERELMEMLGIRVKNHPNPKRLFLSETSPETPLRKNTRV